MFEYETMKPEKRNLIIEQILRFEWLMFQNVEGLNGKAGCQEDWHTFHIMRYAYYNAWSNQMIRSYVKDLDFAMAEKRNLITEKYAYMMEYTDPDYYRSNLMPHLPVCDEETRAFICEIAAYLVQCEKEFAVNYPKLSRKGRPIEAKGAETQDTSTETYIKGELRTYSKFTLKAFAEYIKTCKNDGVNFAQMVKDKMVKMYGYESLEDAERKM